MMSKVRRAYDYGVGLYKQPGAKRPVRTVEPIGAGFTEAEAKAKRGKTVHLSADYDERLREGMIGHVVDYHVNAKNDIEVVTLWDSPDGSGAIHVRFDKSEYDLLLSET
jgi:hypothetical protein